jgi:hypothetical protein
MQYSWDPMSNSMMGIYLEALQIALLTQIAMVNKWH